MQEYNINIEKVEDSFKELSEKIKELGYDMPINTTLSVLEYFSHIALHLAFFTLSVYYSHNLILCFIFLFLTMLSGIGITTGTHTASHHSLVKNKKINNFFVYFGFGLFFGASYQYWMYKHVKVHHPNPNIIGVDQDIDLMPWFVMNQDDYENASNFKKQYFRIQFLIIPFALTLNLFNVQKDGLVHLYNLIKNNGITKKILIDIAIITTHFVVWLIIPSFFFEFKSVLFFYYIRAAFMGYGMFFAFAPAHFPERAIFLTEKNKNFNFIIKQIYTTVNFKVGIIGNYILGGVQYQIEHHLFPNVHHSYYYRMNKLLIAFCKENNLPYNELGWLEGIWESFKVFYKPKKTMDLIIKK